MTPDLRGTSLTKSQVNTRLCSAVGFQFAFVNKTIL